MMRPSLPWGLVAGRSAAVRAPGESAGLFTRVSLPRAPDAQRFVSDIDKTPSADASSRDGRPCPPPSYPSRRHETVLPR
eukprot:7388066-Prymnesium_polylepis.1